jgi:long-chain acyl-CoA synthetase
MADAAVRRLFDLVELYACKRQADTGSLFRKRSGKWQSFSASEYLKFSREIALGLLSLGVKKGTRIATVIGNCPEWNFFDMGIMMAGAVQVPVYPTISSENYCYILNDSGCEYLVVWNSEVYNRVKDICPHVRSLKEVFCVEKVKGLRNWKDLAALGAKHPDPGMLDSVTASVNPEELATVIYTSGTTGRPKGVMLSHRNFISNFISCAKIPELGSDDRALSFLPLCHVYERMLNYVYQYLGLSVYYCDNIEKVGQYVREVRPQVFASVPRVLEKAYDRLVRKGRNMRGIRKQVFFWSLQTGHMYTPKQPAGFYYQLRLFLARLLVLNRWKKALGGRVKLIISGGAALHPRLARIFWAAGIPVLEGYGLTETSPVIAVSTLEKGGMKPGTVGPVLEGLEVRIAPDGEILCRGPNVMMGYYNRPERTSEAIDSEGWFHTGDLGVLEDGKYLRITDRKKEIFKTSAGKYIAPQVIEQKLRESPFIEHVMVIGENRKYTAALIVPDFEHLKGWCKAKSVPFTTPEKAIRSPRIIKRFREEVEKFNTELGQTEKIKKFKLLSGPWSVAGGEYSPTLKLRRNFILEKYARFIEETYRSQEHDYRVGD